MKKLTALVLASAMTATTALAGGIAPVVVEPAPVVVEKPASSISPLIILLILVAIGVAISQQEEDAPA